jgi:outer membrane lipoprotein SlyB
MKATLSFILFMMMMSQAFAWQPPLSGSDYRRDEARRQAGAPVPGTVVYSREVKIEGSSSTPIVGATIGTILGGAIGARSGSTNSRMVKSAILGSALGVAGAYVGARVAQESAQELVVQTDSTQAVTVIQSTEDGLIFTNGSQVYLVNIGGTTRVIPR